MQVSIFVVGLLVSLLGLSGCATTRDFNGLVLVNNSQARDVSSDELLTFLKQDKTNEHEIIEYKHKADYYFTTPKGSQFVYICDESGIVNLGRETLHDYVTSGYECVNFAVDLHNSAEQAGIRCAVVTNLEVGHAFNAFQTSDRGLVYVDAWAGSDSLSYWDFSLGTMVVPYCRVREGVGDTWSEYLGNPENFKVEW